MDKFLLDKYKHKLIDGKALALSIRERIKEDIFEFEASYKRKPCLAVVMIGHNKASEIYVKSKQKACEDVGIQSLIFSKEENFGQENLLNLIDSLNADKNIDGILVQLPLPKSYQSDEVLLKISPDKDVDGFHPLNRGLLSQGNKQALIPCTPLGIMAMLKAYNFDCNGKLALVIGRSNIVGRPMAQLLEQANATVILCHSHTKDLSSLCLQADLIVTAAASPKLLSVDMIKDGAWIIDVSMNRDEDGKLCGDVDFDTIIHKVSYITPVPGGVGPMTITYLLINTLKAAKGREISGV